MKGFYFLLGDCGGQMEIKQGYAYHIKDEYFTTAKDEHLMKNKEDNFPILAMIDCYF